MIKQYGKIITVDYPPNLTPSARKRLTFHAGLIEAYLRGRSIDAIIKFNGIAKSTLYDVLKRYSIDKSQRHAV